MTPEQLESVRATAALVARALDQCASCFYDDLFARHPSARSLFTDDLIAQGNTLFDELLGLIFTACHPMLSPDARAALTIKVVGGLTTDEIARAFLSSEATIAQRIVRAKKAIAKAGLTFEVPRGAERAARLPSVLEVIYLIFNEGYAATAGDDLIRPGLCLEAQRLGRILAELTPREAEVLNAAAVIDGDVDEVPAGAAAPRGGGAASVLAPAATGRDLPELLDVHVQKRSRLAVLVADVGVPAALDDLAGHPVQVPQQRHLLTSQHRADRARRQVQQP